MISKIAGLGDIRKFGSGNPGATNMARFGGKKLAAINLVLDALKGALAVWLGKCFGYEGVAFFAVVVGHCYSAFLGFKGGKGVATTLGGLIALSPIAGVMAVVIWLTVFALFRISSLSAIISLNLVAFASAVWWYREVFWFMLLVALLVTYRHKGNIKRLINGVED